MKKPEDKKEIEQNPSVVDAKDKIEKVLMKWFIDDPVMLGAYCLIDKVPDKSQETIGISSKARPPCIKFNPNFINMISEERLECIMAQEGFKILLKHPTSRLADPKNIASLASSVTVTPMSLGSLLNMEGMDDFFPTPEKFGLKAGEYFEEYFRNLMDDVEDTNQKIKDIWDSMSDEEKQDLVDNAMKAQAQSGQQEEGDGEEKGEGQQPGEGGEGQPQEGEGEGEGGFKEFNSENEAMKEYFNPNGTNAADWQPNDLFDAEVKNLVDNHKNSTRDWGKFTGSAMGEIVAANTPKISWKEVIKKFSRSVMSKRTVCTRMKPNRRHGFRLPGQRREFDTKIIFALDVSGSMSDEDIAEGLAVINATCKHAEITYIMFDTQIKRVETDFKKARGTFKVYGRGGTDFQCIIDYANEHRVDGIVIFTDGEACEPTKPKGRTKLLWLLHSKESRPPCDWGERAFLDRYENTH